MAMMIIIIIVITERTEDTKIMAALAKKEKEQICQRAQLEKNSIMFNFPKSSIPQGRKKRQRQFLHGFWVHTSVCVCKNV